MSNTSSYLTYDEFDKLENRQESILERLQSGPMRFMELVNSQSVASGTTKYHLDRLIALGLVELKEQGRASYYGLTKNARRLLRKARAKSGPAGCARKVLEESQRKNGKLGKRTAVLTASRSGFTQR